MAVIPAPGESTDLEPVVVLGLLNSMAVIVANTETLLADWETLSGEEETARDMLQRIRAHARVVTDALEVAARDVPSDLVDVTSRPTSL